MPSESIVKKFLIEFRKLTELEEYKGVHVQEGDRAYISHCYRQALLANPFCPSTEVACQKVGYVGGKIGGTEIQFPLKMSIDGTESWVGSASLTQVDEWARSSGLGLAISDVDQRDAAYEPVLREGAGLSQVAVKVHRCIGYTVFEYPRLIMLLKSRAVVEKKVRRWLSKPLSVVLDGGIFAYSLLVSCLARCLARGITEVKVDASDDTQLAILGKMTKESHERFSEVHDEKWFKWVLNYSFSEYGSAQVYLVYKKEVPMGFFMVKKRFHEQASHRGFKNVWLGSVIEWGCKPGFEKSLLWRIVRWASQSRKDLDAVEFAANEPSVQRFLRHLGWQHVGDATFCYKVCPGSGFNEPEGMRTASNWRLRPGMGDCALN